MIISTIKYMPLLRVRGAVLSPSKAGSDFKCFSSHPSATTRHTDLTLNVN